MLWREPAAIVVTVGYSFCATYVIAWIMNRVHPIRITARDEGVGIDTALHAESAYSDAADREIVNADPGHA